MHLVAAAAEPSGSFLIALNSSSTCTVQNTCTFEVHRVETSGASTLLYSGEGDVHSIAAVPTSAGGGVAFAGANLRVLQGMTLTSACVRGSSSRTDRLVIANGSTCVRSINFTLANRTRTFTRGADRLLIDSTGRAHLGVHAAFSYTPISQTGVYTAGDSTDGCGLVTFDASGEIDFLRSQPECTIASIRERSDGAIVVGGWSYLTITGDHWVSGRPGSSQWVSFGNSAGGGQEPWVLTVNPVTQVVLDAWAIKELTSARYDVYARQNLGAIEPLSAAEYLVVGGTGERSAYFTNPNVTVSTYSGVAYVMQTPTFAPGTSQSYTVGWRTFLTSQPAADELTANRFTASSLSATEVTLAFLLDANTTSVQAGSAMQSIPTGAPVRFGTVRLDTATGAPSSLDVIRTPNAWPLALTSQRVLARFYNSWLSLDGQRSAMLAGWNGVIAPVP